MEISQKIADFSEYMNFKNAPLCNPIKIRSLLGHSCAILIFFKDCYDLRCLIENDHNFERSEDRATVF